MRPLLLWLMAMTWPLLCSAQQPPPNTKPSPYDKTLPGSLKTALLILLPLLLPNNSRQYTYGNMWFLTEMWHFHRYNALEIGNPLAPYDGKRNLLIKMSDGSVIDIAKVSVDELKKKCQSSERDCSNTHYCGWDTRPVLPNETKWPNGTLELFDSGCTQNFFIASGKIIAVQIGWNPNYDKVKPEIGDPTTGKMYPFPLSEGDLKSLFGKPDTIIDWLQE